MMHLSVCARAQLTISRGVLFSESRMKPIAGNYESECCERAAQTLLELSRRAAEGGSAHLAAILTSTAALLKQLNDKRP